LNNLEKTEEQIIKKRRDIGDPILKGGNQQNPTTKKKGKNTEVNVAPFVHSKEQTSR